MSNSGAQRSSTRTVDREETSAMQMGEQSIPQVYSDGVTVSVSHATITIVFKVSEPWQDPPSDRTVARIQMSPIQFKLLNRVLPQLLAEYERQFGEISTKGIETGIFAHSLGTQDGDNSD